MYNITKDGNVFHNGIKLTQSMTSEGHMSCFYKGGRVSVARLVAERYLGPDPGGCVVAHKNFCNWDNRAENLAWKTKSEAALQKKPGWWKLPPIPDNSREDARIRGVVCDKAEYRSVSEAARRNSTHRGCISRSIRTGCPHKGMVFRYK